MIGSGDDELKLALEDIATDDLEAELERRKLYKPKIEMVAEPDFTALKKVCQNYIDEVYKEKYDDDDWMFRIYDKVMTTYFGDGVFKWLEDVCSG